ncbi:hypothetical protein ZWY2020_032875 [Hordeum vulgare]|nr:hypothetical protein ZWY2020_032875 [Hordeum vulgare]
MTVAEEPANYGDYYVLAVDDPEPDQPADAAAYDETKLWLDMLATLVLLAVTIGLAIYIWHFTHVLEPAYSVQFTGVQGLDPSQSPALSPAFNLSVHVNNRQHIRRVCQEESKVIVYYDEGGNTTTRSIGWGKMRSFCVDRWSTTDLDVSLSNQGLFLSQGLREKIAADLKSQQIDITVEIKPTHPEKPSRPCLTICGVKSTGQFFPGASAMPMPCKCGTLCATERKYIYYKDHRYKVHQRHPPHQIYSPL